MGGRKKIKLWQYNKEGEFIKIWESISDVFDAYFGGIRGEMFPNENVRQLSDGTYISKKRYRKNDLQKIYKILNSEYCRRDNINSKPVSAYNLRGDKIATFSSVMMAHIITKIPYQIIQSSAQSSLKNPDKDQIKEIVFKFGI